MILSQSIGRHVAAFAAALLVSSISLLAAIGPGANPALMI